MTGFGGGGILSAVDHQRCKTTIPSMNTLYFAFIPVKYDANLTKVYSVKMKIVICSPTFTNLYDFSRTQ